MTDLAPPNGGLRAVNNTKSPIHTSLVVPVGDEAVVSEFVAVQLGAAGLTVTPKATKKTAAAKVKS